LNNAGIVALLQERPDVAREHWSQILSVHPDDVASRQLIANSLLLDALGESYTEPAYFLQAEGYYRDIIVVDPTNLYAREALVSVMMLRAQGAILDSTALVQDDMVAFSKSQIMWPLDPERRQETSDVYAAIIAERRILASELQPGEPSAEVAVAEAYLERHMLIFSALLTMKLLGEENPDEAEMGAQLLADGQQIREWSERVLVNPQSSRVDQLRSWAVLAETLERQWSWYAFFEEDEAKASELDQEHRQVVSDAVAYGEAEPVKDLEEIPPLRTIYFKAVFIAEAWDADTASAATHRDRIAELSQRESRERQEGISHYTTFCKEIREQQAGDALLAQGNAAGAQSHYEAALEANPGHTSSRLGLATARFQQGDVEGAVSTSMEASEVSANQPAVWAALGFYQLASGDIEAAKAAYGRFLDLVGQLPPQERMAVVRDSIDRLSDQAQEDPEFGPLVTETIPVFGEFLDGMASDGIGSYQYPGLYAELGALALNLDQAPVAEPLFRRSLELDSHQPTVHANLVVSVLVQGKDGSGAITAAFTDIDEPYWTQIYSYSDPDTLLTMMDDEVSGYVDRYPDRQDAVEPFQAAISEKRGQLNLRKFGADGNVYTNASLGHGLTWDNSRTFMSASNDVVAATAAD
jgi:tetratricopeptide (TPR) repeat protein